MSGETLQVRVIQGSILEVDCQVIVNAANSLGFMGGGVAGVIKRAGGIDVEKEARGRAPIPVGEAVITTAGKTGFAGVIHAPTMEQPGIRIGAENVALATRAALALADQKGFVSIALPGMGTGVGGVAHAEAASRMVGEVEAYRAKNLRTVTLVDVDAAMVEAWRGALVRQV